jgi:hypothetical protein
VDVVLSAGLFLVMHTYSSPFLSEARYIRLLGVNFQILALLCFAKNDEPGH